MRPVAPGLVRQIKVLPDQAPDCSSLKSIAESVTRGCTNNDQKAIAVYNFMQLTHYHRQYPGEPGGVPVLKEINCYGWSLCGGLHAEQSAIWRELGWDWRFVGWDGHTTVEAKYDDRWHYLDVFLKFYAWMPDGKGGRTIAGEDDLNNDAASLIRDAFIMDEERRCVYMKDNPFVLNGNKANWRAPAFLGCGDELSGVIGGLKTHRGRDRSAGLGGDQPRQWRITRPTSTSPRASAWRTPGTRCPMPGIGPDKRLLPPTPAAATRIPATIRASDWCSSPTSTASRPAAMPTAYSPSLPISRPTRSSSRLSAWRMSGMPVTPLSPRKPANLPSLSLIWRRPTS